MELMHYLSVWWSPLYLTEWRASSLVHPAQSHTDQGRWREIGVSHVYYRAIKAQRRASMEESVVVLWCVCVRVCFHSSLSESGRMVDKQAAT